ncbi:MAG: FliI/YscN family ATPase [Lautropia sp.]|nr:FliI/YscN family ATPase [Lautropia sp.]
MHFADQISAFLGNCQQLAAHIDPVEIEGRLVKVSGMLVEASGISLPVGALCLLRQPSGEAIEAEVVGFGHGHTFLMPSGNTNGLSPDTRVCPLEPEVITPTLSRLSHPWRRQSDRMRQLPIGDGLLGRVVDACGQPLDGRGHLQSVRNSPIQGRIMNAMERQPIRQSLDSGVRAINGLLTIGRGQRIGLFAGAGLGKSVLLGMMANYTDADVIVVGLIGERGREIKEFLDDILGPGHRDRAVIVAAPSDISPILRIQGAHYATAIAEYFRDKNLNVLFLMDSLTRYAMASREISLSIGESPATKGYPPSVFARLPALIERTGMGPSGSGSITAFYTVLAEGDDQNDPVADASRSFLDGHIVLTRELADAGHYPAIDIEKSISRVMTGITSKEHQQLARELKSLWSAYRRSRELITIGAYTEGSDARIDRAIALMPGIESFLCQDVNDQTTLAATMNAMKDLLDQGGSNRMIDSEIV